MVSHGFASSGVIALPGAAFPYTPQSLPDLDRETRAWRDPARQAGASAATAVPAGLFDHGLSSQHRFSRALKPRLSASDCTNSRTAGCRSPQITATVHARAQHIAALVMHL